MIIPTKCPYTFRPMDPEATQSPYLPDKELPRGWQNSGTFTVSMAGARASGKSVYLAVLIRLMEQFTIKYGGVWEAANPQTQEIYDRHFGSLFEEKGRALESTRRMSDQATYTTEPLIFSMGRLLIDGVRTPQPYFMVFRDVAGEDLEDTNVYDVQDDLAFMGISDLIVFLFDPLADQDISQALQGMAGMNAGQALSSTPPGVVLSNVLRIIGPHRPPIALTLSKFDVLQRLRDTDGAVRNMDKIMRNQGAAFNREGCGAARPWSEDDSLLLHYEITSLLRTLGATRLFNQLDSWTEGDRAYDYRCFAVSALGFEVQDDMVSHSGIAPFRCLDPVRFMLSRYGLGL
ncbi:hypothetical protein [Corynebacterium aquatimens]|uniref:Uncharacterized protein n=1 Tax=Corynebacterium aquatimens TaxID=1190508 RepID=A0A931DYT1_9CORY|nr:hypothetical protein [Corynebacterium aquatimens]MBG6122897.1 hypothetical protein [Corynebacterium aquatimens]WJY66768.1 hypothetical protein CAQUA_10405 [Corynebacterium aquatimens]